MLAVAALLHGCVSQVAPNQWNEVSFEGGKRSPLDGLILGLNLDGKRLPAGARLDESFAAYRQRVLQDWMNQRIASGANPAKEIRALGCEDVLRSEVYGFSDCLYSSQRTIRTRKKAEAGIETIAAQSRIAHIRFIVPSRNPGSTGNPTVIVRIYDAEAPEPAQPANERAGLELLHKIAALAHLNAVDHKERAERILGITIPQHTANKIAVSSETPGFGANRPYWRHSAIKQSIGEQSWKKPGDPEPRRASIGVKVDASRACVTPDRLFGMFPGATIRRNLVFRHPPTPLAERETSWDSISLLDPAKQLPTVGAVFDHRRCADSIGMVQYRLSTGED